MNSFEGENMGTQYNALGHSIDFIFMTISLQKKLIKIDTTTEILTTK